MIEAMPTLKQSDAAEKLDVDVRFLLANERTLLAWIRTSLALLAGGLALGKFGKQGVTTNLVSLVAILMGAAAALTGYVRYKAADRAIRSSKLPIEGRGPILQTGAILVFAIVAVILLFVVD